MSQLVQDMQIAENLVVQARNCRSIILEEFYDKFMKSSDNVDNLKQLFLFLHSSDKKLLPQEITTVLMTTLCNPSTNTQIKPLVKNKCSLILSESCPNSDITLSEFLDGKEHNTIINMLPFINLQGEQWFGNCDVQNKIIRLISEKGEMQALRVLRQLCQMCNALNIDDESMRTLGKSLSTNLTKTSRLQAVNPNTSARFWQSENQIAITEMDGTPSSELFTVLNMAQYNTADQFINIHTFSSISPILPHILKTNKNPDILQSDDVNSPSIPLIEYCTRIMDQAERVSLKLSDSQLQQATLTEAIKILDLVCEDNVDLISRIFPKIRKCLSVPYNNQSSRKSQLCVRLASLTFILNHGDTISRDPRPILEQFFSEEIASHIWNQMESAVIVLFIRKNLEKLCFNSSILETYFPNIFKILAWHPVTFLNDFLDILPSFMSTSTATEIFNTILDLPCITSSLLLTGLEHGERDIPKNPDIPSKNLWQEFTSPTNRSMFNFVLRKSSGQGDTFDRVGILHGLISELTCLPRVKSSISIVIPLLKVYFEIVLEHCDTTLATKLLPAMLERINLLFTFPAIQVEIQELIANSLVPLIQVNPSLLVEAHSEITDYLATLQNMSQSFYANLVTLIGQYVAGDNEISVCQLETITSFYETLECVVYEHLSMKDKTWSEVMPRTISITVATLAKLAAICQDLIPRVLLCLTKVQQQTRIIIDEEVDSRWRDWSIVNSRTADLITVLRHPSLASVVLSSWSAFEKPKRLHDGNTSVPALLRVISSTMANKELDQNV